MRGPPPCSPQNLAYPTVSIKPHRAILYVHRGDNYNDIVHNPKLQGRPCILGVSSRAIASMTLQRFADQAARRRRSSWTCKKAHELCQAKIKSGAPE